MESNLLKEGKEDIKDPSQIGEGMKQLKEDSKKEFGDSDQFEEEEWSKATPELRKSMRSIDKKLYQYSTDFWLQDNESLPNSMPEVIEAINTGEFDQRGLINGKLYMTIGPMFSGKTENLIAQMRRHKAAKKSCIIIKYREDTRYSFDKVTTHNGEGNLEACSTHLLEDLFQECSKCDVIGIDEIQFFKDAEPFCKCMLALGKLVNVAGLNGDSNMQPWKAISDLIPLCDDLVLCSAVCMDCGEKAPFTKRIVESSNKELIGGADKYKSVCRKCYGKSI